MELASKVAIITGGASGIGRAASERFIAHGARVAIFDSDAERGRQAAQALGDAASFHLVDVTEEEAVAEAVKNVQARHDAIHICLNFAGVGSAVKTVGKGGPHPLDAYKRVIAINLIGTFNVLRLCADVMCKQDPVTDDGQRGVIINTASIAAYEGQVGQVAYSASKGGVVGMTLPIARDLAPFGVRCNTIVPGLIHTPLFDTLEPHVYSALEGSVLNPKRLGQPDEIARTAQWIVENDYVNAECIRVDGGIRMQPR